MQITQILNNSSVIVSSEEGELIVLGKGIGFGKKLVSLLKKVKSKENILQKVLSQQINFSH